MLKFGRASFDERLLLPPNNAQPESLESVSVVGSNNRWPRRRFIRINVRRVLGRVGNGIHFFFAALLVQGTYDNGLPDGDIAGRA
jgi:hypothetical protein